MCDKCQQLEIKIRRYRWFVGRGLDALTVERISLLIQELQQSKEAMHTEAAGSRPPPVLGIDSR
jgi:hypothetical protein